MAQKSTSVTSCEDVRISYSVAAIKQSISDNLLYIQGRSPDVATDTDWYLALAYSVRDRLLNRWLHSERVYKQQGSRTVCYLSAEFLIGPQLGKNLVNLGIWDKVDEALRQLGLDLKQMLRQEEEPGLGNGGWGVWRPVIWIRWQPLKYRR